MSSIQIDDENNIAGVHWKLASFHYVILREHFQSVVWILNVWNFNYSLLFVEQIFSKEEKKIPDN